VLNMPYYRKIIRKYSCSFHAVGFLYPPVELLRIATILQENLKVDNTIVFLDAIAEGINYQKCQLKISELKPDLIITLASVDFINDEYAFLKKIKASLHIPCVLVGHIPSLFPDIFQEAEAILGNQFEGIIQKAALDLKNPNACELIGLIDIYKNNTFVFNPDIIEKHNNTFLNRKLYNELFVKGTTAFTYFSFGCPFNCSYCISTYHLKKVYFRKTDHIIRELSTYVSQGIKNIRILDDNISLNKELLKSIVDFQLKTGHELNFYGLTRLDLLEVETINLLFQAGFKRLLIGIESIKPETQKTYNKQFALSHNDIKTKLVFLKQKGIEVYFFILFNPLTENTKDIKNTLKFLKQMPVYFANISYIIPYPGTDFFETHRSESDFFLSPTYYSKLKKEYYQNIIKHEILFFIGFYLKNPKVFFHQFKYFIKFPRHYTAMIRQFFKFFFSKTENRQDYL